MQSFFKGNFKNYGSVCFMYVDASSACMVCMYHMPAWYPPRSEEDIRVSETEVMGSCALPCGCWPLNSGPLQIRVLLSTEPSFQSSSTYRFRSCFYVETSSSVLTQLCSSFFAPILQWPAPISIPIQHHMLSFLSLDSSFSNCKG